MVDGYSRRRLYERDSQGLFTRNGHGGSALEATRITLTKRKWADCEG
jgi:hypothetical protein